MYYLSGFIQKKVRTFVSVYIVRREHSFHKPINSRAFEKIENCILNLNHQMSVD